ncbi:MAG: M48 family metallopeptidase [Pseudomonadota bacterium]
MTVLGGYYFDGKSALRHPAELELAGNEVRLKRDAEVRSFPSAELLVSPRTGAQSRLLTLPDGGQFQCDDADALDRLPQVSPGEGIVAWLEQRWGVALGCVVLVALVLFAGHRFGLPAAAESIALRIPIESEQNLGEQVLDSMHEFGWLLPSQIDVQRQEKIRARFNQFRRGQTYEAYLDLQFRASGAIGPNAFALPGGTVVITDDLVRLAETDEEVLAILAHEIGHIERRHVMRTLIQNSLVAVAATAVTADAATLTAAVAGLPVVLLQSEYSREFEEEADEYSFALLQEHGISPDAFADIMERLQLRYPDSESTLLNFLSTHPQTESRISNARRAADEDEPTSDPP